MRRPSSFLIICVLILFASSVDLGKVHAMDAEMREAIDVRAYQEAAPSCAESTGQCFGLRIHLAVDDGAPVVAADWLAASLAASNEMFAPAGASFRAVSFKPSKDLPIRIASRKDRDALGASETASPVIDVFVVKALADLEDRKVVRLGVHWRMTDSPSRRFIIVSSAAHAHVLAHELAHFFGLPHSSYPISIMNKTPRALPPLQERRFADDELPILKRTMLEIVKRRELISMDTKPSSP
jgi:hypothetical protein